MNNDDFDFVIVPRDELIRMKDVFHRAARVDGLLNGYDWLAYDAIAAACLGLFREPSSRLEWFNEDGKAE